MKTYNIILILNCTFTAHIQRFANDYVPSPNVLILSYHRLYYRIYAKLWA